jgi:hypothetical protein
MQRRKIFGCGEVSWDVGMLGCWDVGKLGSWEVGMRERDISFNLLKPARRHVSICTYKCANYHHLFVDEYFIILPSDSVKPCELHIDCLPSFLG